MRAALMIAIAASGGACTLAPASPSSVAQPAPVQEPPPPPRVVEALPRPMVTAWPHPPQTIANLGALIRHEDYPAEAKAARRGGNTAVTLTVGPDGRVTGCTVTASAGFAALDSATCRLLRSRARFRPARDAAGNPTTGSVATVIHWRI